MLEGINFVAVIGTTAFMMASATVWFSSLLFGQLWLRELGVTEEEIEASRRQLPTHLILTAVAYGAALTILALVIVQTRTLEVSSLQVGIAAAVLVVAVLGNTTLWENRSQVYFVITAGFYAYFVVVGTLMLAYWPW